jgi:hypothetical protein
LTIINRKIEEEGIKNLKHEGLLQLPELIEEGSIYYQKPAQYALHIFEFYICSRCIEPYCGGKRDCAQGMEV